MSNITGKIQKIEFDITKNNNIATRVWLEGSDLTDLGQSYAFYSDSHYTIALNDGDNIEINKNKDFYNVVIPESYSKVWDGDSVFAKILHRIHDNFRVALVRVKNGEKNKISSFEVEQDVRNKMSEFFDICDMVLGATQESESKFAKYLMSQMEMKKSSRSFDTETFVSCNAKRYQDELRKHFEMVKTTEEM